MNSAPIQWESIAPPANYNELRQRYGHPDTDPNFESNYIVTQPLTLAGGELVHVRSHIAVKERLTRVFDKLKASGLISTIHTEDGCFNIRRIAGHAALSLHSWGLAIDVNAELFPSGCARTQNAALVAAFQAEHFYNGANFRRLKDPMHFEFCRELF